MFMLLGIHFKVGNLALFFCTFSNLSVVFAGLENSPKIITKEGNVILEAAINRNITIKLNGRSKIVVNDLDLINLLQGEKWLTNSSSSLAIDVLSLRVLQDDVKTLKTRLLERGGLAARLRRLQNRTRISNPANMLRRTQRRITSLESRVQSLVRTLELDNCYSNPCENSGSCFDVFDGFICKCTKGFEGRTCSADVNECALYAGTDIGCQNGAQCINQFGSYSCICNLGWQGIHCNQRLTDCMHSSNIELCAHGACVNANDNFGYRCICEQGWSTNGLTPSCSIDVDECAELSNPCSSKCLNLPGGFVCAPCDDGYTGNGLSCRDIDECSTYNGGCSAMPFVPCINTYGSFHCGECPVGWVGDGRVCTRSSGKSCSRNNICHPSAICQEISNRIVCSCPLGLIGNGVGPNGCSSSGGNICSFNTCLNGGTCMDTGNGSFTCLCPIGYRSPNCEKNFNPCSINPCKNGGICRPQRNAFICSCVTGYEGRLCDSQRSRCGQYISSEQGNLKYPESNLYNHNAQCSWVIRTDETKVLNITFSKFDIEDSLECRFDWLQIHDGPTAAAQLIGRFCGSTAPLGGMFITTTNRIYIWFKSDNSTAKAGFDLLWTSTKPICGGFFEFDSHATISSPGSPGSYPRNRDCKWHLKVSNDKRIKLVFFNLQIEKHSNCNHDYLEIKDAISDSQLEIFCNSSNPAPITMPSNEIVVHFHSDNEGSDLGFQIHASTVERIPGCGGVYTDRNGQFSSPYGFDGSISCEFIVRYPKGIKVELKVSEFEMGDDDCIEILNVHSGIKESTGKWCGKMIIPTFYSASNEVQINYYSKGGTFKIIYGSICEYIFEESSGVITSPNYPNTYPSEETCTYEVIGEANQVVSLEFIDLDLEPSLEISSCWFDHITITDGSNETAAGPFCGSTIPPKIVSNTNLLKIKLQTDRSNSGRGFKANYTIIGTTSACGGIIRKSSGEIRLPSDGASGFYKPDLTCTWTIIAPSGYGIQLSWIAFRLEESSDCVYDYLEIYDTEKITSDTIGNYRFCGSTLPPSMVSAANVMTLKFSSDYTDADSGFLAKYNFVSVSSLCGGALFSSTGTIYSPNWPNEYPSNLNCTWSITVPTGRQIELLVKSMQLEEAKDCANDWVEIRNGAYATSPFIGKYCGNTIPTHIPSFTNQIYINFITNSEISKNGFQMEWQTVAFGCGGTLSTDHGSVASPFYPKHYNADAQCEWRISVNKGSTVEIKFEDISMESTNACMYDYVEVYDGLTLNARKIAKYCQTQNNNPIVVKTTGSDALIRFQSDTSNSDRGFYLTYKSNCNQKLIAMHGVIESPNLGDNNPSDISCTWIIQAPMGNRIFLDFDILGWKEGDLRHNYVFLIDNNTVFHISEPRRIESQGNSIEVQLNSSATYFRLEYAIKGCIKSFHRASGEFTSPGYPKVYPNAVECLWQIDTEFGKAIELVFSDIDIEGSTNCTNDSIRVWSTEQRLHMIGSYCGKRDNLTVTSTGPTLVIEFHSNARVNGKGFTANYNTIESKCGGKYHFPQGSIYSPNYPNNYFPNLHCEWEIQVSEHSTMNITVEELDIEDSYTCISDSLKIYDGDKVDRNNPWKNLCGDQIPLINVYRTTSNTALVVLDTDTDYELKGFKLLFKENCGKRIVITSENSSGRLRFTGSDQLECLWVVAAEDTARHVTFTTTHVQLSILSLENVTNDDCDGVLIFDGDIAQTTVVRPKRKICSKNPPASTSFGHALTIKLNPKLIYEFEGFYSIMDNNCGGQYNSLHGTFASPSYPLPYPVNIECIWEIIASDGNALSLTIQHMDIDISDDCNGDYLEVREGGNAGRLIGVFCGDDTPETLTAQKSLWIKFNSDNDYVRRGFIAEYSYALHTDLNGTGGIIESPKYPKLFTTITDHSWRISVPRGELIILTFEYYMELYENYITFYNGYDEHAEQIEHAGSNIIRSDTNVLYMKSSTGVFKFRWYKVSKDFMDNNKTAIEQNSMCTHETVSVGKSSVVFQSPGYPNGYESDLNCSWIVVPDDPSTHAVVAFQIIDLEDDKNCASDRIVIYSSIDMTNWKQLDKKCKMKPDSVYQVTGERFLKVEFISDFGVNKTGFSATAYSSCGSTLTDESGFINATNYIFGVTSFQISCVYKIQVKTGRRIKFTFFEFGIMKDTSEFCRSYVLIKNGISEYSPNLGIGKYCDSNLPDIPITSSNEAYVKLNFERILIERPRISFKYEEVLNECSININLDQDHSFEVINSENYPNIPHPHTMCVWHIRAPIDRLIAANFVDPMDLKRSEFCDLEYVGLFDGGTELSPIIGRFCGNSIPDTKYSSGNILRVTYFTDIAEPHIGFKLNISLGICGGTYRQGNGTISSPATLTVKTLKNHFSCDYTILLPENNAVNITINEVILPFSDNCSEVNHLEITPIYSDDEMISEPIIICGLMQTENYFLETNKVRISYRLLTNELRTYSFKLTYSAVGHQCGRSIEAESGILKSPGYLFPIRFPTRCVWKIKVPKGRKIKIEFLEYNMASDNTTDITNRIHYRVPSRLLLANDFELKSVIQRILQNPPSALYSTDNIMTILSFEGPTTQKQGFKLRFSSEEESEYCNEDFDRVQGNILFQPQTNISVHCRYKINVRLNETVALTVDKIEAKTDILHDIYSCFRNGPLSIRDLSADWGLFGNTRTYWFCGNRNESTVRLSYPAFIDIHSSTRNKLTLLDLKFSRHNCGGVFIIGNQFQLREPYTLTMNYGAMDCAWRVLSNPGDLENFEITLSVDFKLKCDEEYLILYSDSTALSPHLGRFCNQMTVSNLISMKDLLIEYHTSNYELGSTFNLTAKVGTGCGAELSFPFRLIDFRKQYQNNVECIWTIRASKEYHIGLTFIGRFFIESSVNCTKDYILIQEEVALDEWNDIQIICGRVPPASVNTTTNSMRFIFRSDDSGTGDGFTANFDRNCGGVFQSTKDMQTLASPGYPSPYDFNLTCNYTIIPSDPNKNIHVQLNDFWLEDSPGANCGYDNLTVYMTSADPEVLCGKNRKGEFRSGHPITLIFKSDGSYSEKGFLLLFGDEMCGGTITSTTVIATPKQMSNNMYPSNTICVWNITAAEGSKIIIKFEKFHFEGSLACNYDYVEVFSGKVHSEDHRVAKLCGELTAKLPILRIKSNFGIIQSASDGSEPSLGFSALVSIVKDCDKDIELTDSNNKYYLQDFATEYDNDLDCGFLFTATPGNQLMLEFTSFHIENSRNCEGDYVQILDGGGPFADEIGKFCGHETPNHLMSSRSTMFVRFVSDSSDTSAGFAAIIRMSPLICGAQERLVKSNESTVITTGSKETYEPNMNCFWHLKASNNIHLDFEKLDIQGPNENGTCTRDYLKIYNRMPYSVVENVFGSDVVFNGDVGPTYANMFDGVNSEHVFCGQSVPEGYYTNNQEVFIKFFSDSTIERSGFKIIASVANGCFKNFTSTQGRILMGTDSECNIYINAPKNYSITIYFSYMYFYGGGEECTSNFIEIFDERAGNMSVVQSVRKICGSLEPSNSVFTDSNKLRLFLSHHSLYVNYDINFLASDKGAGCGGDFYNVLGIFTSPFYPSNMRNSSDCRWNIRVPNNMVVHLEFRAFDLGSKVTCHSDYLQILEQELGKSEELARQFCGEDVPIEYTSRRNVLSVRFRKTVNFDGTGWVIRFSGIRNR